MGQPLYTGGGDRGDTSLADGSRVSKASPRVEACGALDEAAAALGLARVVVFDTDVDRLLEFAQHRLLGIAGALAAPGTSDGAVDATDSVALERATDRLMDAVGPPGGFTLPGGGEAGARLHVARTAVRRAERRTVALASAASVDPLALRFLNRLSDALYAAARHANADDGVAERPWDGGFPTPEE